MQQAQKALAERGVLYLGHGISTQMERPAISKTDSQCRACLRSRQNRALPLLSGRPAHLVIGKGPWDGIGAVVKRLLRSMERYERMYATGARDVFLALVEEAATLKDQIGSSVMLSDIVYHYIITANEPDLDMLNVWPAISRLKVRPSVTAIAGIRSAFCFRVAGANILASRELSCRCTQCLAHQWNDCENSEAEHCTFTTVVLKQASVVAKTRSQRALVSEQRRKLSGCFWW